MRHLLGLLLITLSLVLTGCGAGGASASGPSGSGSPGGPSGAEMSEAERAWAMEVLALVNAERTQQSLGALQWSEPAAGVAFDHSLDMQQRSFFSHTNPDNLGPGDRINAANIPWTGWGENIARGQNDPPAVMNAWMNSQGHRDNILNPIFTHLGVGVRFGSIGPWWTQVFLRQ